MANYFVNNHNKKNVVHNWTILQLFTFFNNTIENFLYTLTDNKNGRILL